MSFVRADGWAIKVADGALEEIYERGGESGRLYDGTPFDDVHYEKRRWKGKTPPLDELTARAVRGVLRGEGDLWSFVDSEYSAKGLGGSAGVVGGVPWEADSGDWVYSTGGHLGDGNPSPWGSLDEGAVNLVGANVRTGDSVAGCSAISGSTITSESGEGVNGAAIKVAGTGVGDGIDLPNITGLTGSTSYTLSFWVRADDTDEITADLIAPISGSLGTVAVTFTGDTTNRWVRATKTVQTGGLDTQIQLRFTKSGGGAVNFYLDRIQLIELSYDAAFADGTRAKTNITYPAPAWLTGATDLTIAFWVYTRALGDVEQTILYLTDNDNGKASDTTKLLFQWDRVSARYEITWGNGFSENVLSTGSQPTETWTHVAFVWRADPEGGEVKASLYIDGVLNDTENAITYPLNPVRFAALQVGWFDGANDEPRAMRIAELRIAPYAMPATQIAALFAMGDTSDKLAASSPRFYFDGAAIPDQPFAVVAEGKADSSKYLAANIGNDFRNNLRVVDFEILEV